MQINKIIWLQHVERMEEYKLPKCLMNDKLNLETRRGKN
jgi:hypothetical protein